MTTNPQVSVIIATYSRAQLLDECLQHLAVQGFLPGDEVIVVDNASVDDTAAIVARHQARFPTTLHLLYEPQPGKSHALARAMPAATGDVLAFLDDDVNVDARWLDVVRDTMRDSSVGLMGGRVVPRWESSVPDWMRSAPSQHPRLGAPLGLLEYPAEVVELGPRTVLGANMAVRRHVFDVVGGFATHLGKLRGTLLSGEDHELCVRVQQAGFEAVYVPNALVHHWAPADRARVGYFLHWFYWSGITHAIMDAESGRGARVLSTPEGRDVVTGGGRDFRPAIQSRSLMGLPFYLCKRAMLGTLRVLKALVVGDRTAALHHAIDVAFVAGYAAHQWGLTSRRRVSATSITPEAA